MLVYKLLTSLTVHCSVEETIRSWVVLCVLHRCGAVTLRPVKRDRPLTTSSWSPWAMDYHAYL